MITDPMPRRAFLYLRHGETDWNAAGRAQGTSDVPLNALGRTQARDAGALLASCPIARVVASPLVRARETAEIVAVALATGPVAIEPALREVAFGSREGETMGPWYEAWLEGLATPEGGETFAALGARAHAAVSRHLCAMPDAPHDATILFVAHGALFRALRAVLGLPIHVRLINGAPMWCRPDGDGWRIEPLG